MITVAFLGLGRMGTAMARRLLEGGCRLQVFNRTPSRAQNLVALGAHRFPTAREACAGADAIISMVADDQASKAIWWGPDGALAAAPAPGTLAIECSTLSYGWVLDLSAEAQSLGLRYLDAPVTGLPDAAAAGELTLLVGATAEDLNAGRPLLERCSQRILHFGPPGTGTAYKLLVNMLGAVQIASVAETIAIAEKIGLDLGLVAEALASGQAASPQVIRNARRMIPGQSDHTVVFTPQLRLKDVDYALALARTLGIGSPFGALAARLYRELNTLGYAQANESEVIEVARKQQLPDNQPGSA
jgi:3-hydroxyisobutyrate dehydrogenase